MRLLPIFLTCVALFAASCRQPPAPPPAPPVVTSLPPPPPFSVTHDTPIIVQGGSLSVWAPGGFAYESRRNLIIPVGSPLKYIFLDNNSDLSNIDNKPPAVTFLHNDSWELCTGPPQNVQYVQNPANNLTISLWDTAHLEDGFAPEPPGTGRYAHGDSHSRTTGFGGIYFSPTSRESCSTVVAATATCPGTPDADCQVVPPSATPMSPKVYVVLSTK
jgi:hypothetical protein